MVKDSAPGKKIGKETAEVIAMDCDEPSTKRSSRKGKSWIRSQAALWDKKKHLSIDSCK